MANSNSQLNYNSKFRFFSVLTLFGYFSGAKVSLLREIPRYEQNTYILTGLFTLLVSCLNTILLFSVLRHGLFSNVTSFNKIVIIYSFFFILFILQFLATRQLIRERSLFTRTIFLLVTLLPVLIIITSILTKPVGLTKTDEPFYNVSSQIDSLTQVKRKIESALDDLEFEKDYNKKMLNEISPTSKILDYKKNREYEERVYLTQEKIDSLTLVDDFLTSKLTYLTGLKKAQSDINKPGQSIINVIKPPYSQISFFIFGLFTFLLNLITYFRVERTRYDAYHELFDADEKLKAEELVKARKTVLEDFKIKNEIKQKASVYENLEGSVNENSAEISKIRQGLNSGYTPEALMTSAELEMNAKNYEKALSYIDRAIELEHTLNTADINYIPDPRFFELKAKILNLSSDFETAKVVSDRYVELSSEKRYQDNLKKEILLERLSIENLPFYGTFIWNFQPGINILLGKNGYGKSHLMGLIVSLLYDDKTKLKEWIPEKAFGAKAKLYLNSDHEINQSVIDTLNKELSDLLFRENEIKEKKQPDKKENNELVLLQQRQNEIVDKLDAERRRIFGTNDSIKGFIGRVPILAIPDSRFIDKSESTIENSKTASEDLRRDGATEFLYSKSFAGIVKKGLFLTAQKNSSDFTKEPYHLIERVISYLAGNKMTAFAETNADNKTKGKKFFTFQRIELTNTTGDYKFFVKSEGNNEEFLLQKISQGTFSVLAMCLTIYRFLSELKPDSKNVLKEKAIVFIDEIDAHLHPSWEQKIIGILRNEFPNVQFIITAHSPLVIAGCFEREVAVMKQKPDGFIMVQLNENFIGYKASDLLEKVFGLEDKDDQFLKYSAMASEEEKIKKIVDEYNKLDASKLNENDKQEMDKNFKTLNYIRSAKNIQSKNANASLLETENLSLKSENTFLKEKIKEINSKLDANKKPL